MLVIQFFITYGNLIFENIFTQRVKIQQWYNGCYYTLIPYIRESFVTETT